MIEMYIITVNDWENMSLSEYFHHLGSSETNILGNEIEKELESYHINKFKMIEQSIWSRSQKFWRAQ